MPDYDFKVVFPDPSIILAEASFSAAANLSFVVDPEPGYEAPQPVLDRPHPSSVSDFDLSADRVLYDHTRSSQ
jgi:hypothetical protein